MRNKKHLLIFIFIIMISMVQAGGFRVSLQGVRQTAMAHTSAHVRDASVAFFNPGGIAFIPSKLSISSGGFLVGTKVNYQNLQTHYKASTDNPISTPMTFNVAYKATNQISVALSITTPFGSTVNWGGDWAGKDLINKIELQAFYIQPTVAYRFNNWISVGAGFIYATGNVNLQKSLTPVNGQMKLEDKNASGNGFNVGVYLRPTDKLDISVAYRSKVDMKAKKGKAEFDIPSSLVGESPFLTSTDQFSATLPLASEFTLGLTYRVLPKLSISADWNVSGWNRYENLTFNFKKNQVGNLENDPTVSMAPKKFKNSNTFRIGGEYLVTEYLAVRLGYYYDQSPVRSNFWSPETPSTNNNAVTGGVGYSFYNKKLMVDLSGIYYVGKSRKFNNEFYNFSGEANLSSFIVGLGLTWNPF